MRDRTAFRPERFRAATLDETRRFASPGEMPPMAGAAGYALVGSAGTAVVGTSGGAISTLAFGTGESRTAGNLLICWAVGGGVSTLPTTPSGWSSALGLAGTSCSAAVFYKIAAGGDAAPSFGAVTSQTWVAQVAEFSGNASSAPADTNGGTSTPGTGTMTAVNQAIDAQSGELDTFCAVAFYSTTTTRTLTSALNNGATATLTGNNSGASAAVFYSFGYGVPTGNSAVDAYTFTTTTTKLTGAVAMLASFKLPPKVFVGRPTIVGQAVQMAATR